MIFFFIQAPNLILIVFPVKFSVKWFCNVHPMSKGRTLRENIADFVRRNFQLHTTRKLSSDSFLFSSILLIWKQNMIIVALKVWVAVYFLLVFWISTSACGNLCAAFYSYTFQKIERKNWSVIVKNVIYTFEWSLFAYSVYVKSITTSKTTKNCTENWRTRMIWL